jgi:hypothetical protein
MESNQRMLLPCVDGYCESWYPCRADDAENLKTSMLGRLSYFDKSDPNGPGRVKSGSKTTR